MYYQVAVLSLMLNVIYGQSFDPAFYELLQDSNSTKNISEKCRVRFNDLLDLEQPANLAFFDALGKPTSGITVGSFQWLGNYDLCISLKKYNFVPCKSTSVIRIEGEAAGKLLWTTCLPRECKDEFIDLILERINVTMQLYLNETLQLEDEIETKCYEEVQYDTGAYIAIVFVSTFTLLTLLATIYKPCCGYLNWITSAFKTTTKCCANDPGVVVNKAASDGTKMQAIKPKENVYEEYEKEEGTANGVHANGVHGNGALPNGKLEVLEPCREIGTLSTYDNNMSADPNVGDDGELGEHHTVQFKLPSIRKGVLKRLEKVFECFSLSKNLGILLSTKVGKGQVSCLNGLRVLSIIWVLLGHFYLQPLLFGPIGDMYQGFEMSNRTSFEVVLNAFPAVDTFFLMSGFLVSYLLLKKFQSGKTFRSMALGYYIHRYIRLTVPYVAVILVQGFLYRQITTGPFADILEGTNQNCKDWWWTNILYVNNIVPWGSPSRCIGQAWYLADDMQFFIIAPLFIIALWKRPVIGVALSAGVTVLSVITSIVLTDHYNYATTPFRAGVSNPNMFALYYVMPHIRIPPYLMGVLGGWAYFKYSPAITQFAKTDPKTRLLLAVPLWMITIAVQYGVVFGIHGPNIAPYQETETMRLSNAALSRLGWAGSLLCQILLCQSGMGGVINTALSWKGWLPLSRLSYGLYLLHYGLNIVWIVQLRHVWSFRPDFQMVTQFMGLVVFVNLAAAVLFLLVEQPVANIERMFLNPPPRKPTIITNNSATPKEQDAKSSEA